MTVLLCGRLENPVVFCTKAICDDNKQALIPLAVRVDVPVQKFRLPFLTKAGSDDTDFEFIFIKTVRTEFNEEMCQVFDRMVFFCQPSVLKVSAKGKAPAILNVQLKVDCEKMLELPRRVLKQRVTKLLIARV